MRRVVPLLTLFLLLPALLPSGAEAQGGTSVVVSAGIFDTAAWFEDRGKFDSVEAGVALHGPSQVWGLVPMGGISANDDGAFWAHLGVGRPFGGRAWSVTPSFAVAYYEQGDGKDLGNELEFRSGLAVARRGANGRSIGAEIYHLSNASISDVNPGSNSFVVTYAIPLGR